MLAAPPGGNVHIYRELASVETTWAHDAVNISYFIRGQRGVEDWLSTEQIEKQLSV
jgi:hypothetical protein